MTDKIRAEFEAWVTANDYIVDSLYSELMWNGWQAALATRPDVCFSEDKFQEAIQTLDECENMFGEWYLDEGELRSFVAKCVAPAPDVNQELVGALEEIAKSDDCHELWYQTIAEQALAKHKTNTALPCREVQEPELTGENHRRMVQGGSLPDVNQELVEALEMIVFEHESCPPAERKMFHIAKQALAKHKAGEIRVKGE